MGRPGRVPRAEQLASPETGLGYRPGVAVGSEAGVIRGRPSLAGATIVFAFSPPPARRSFQSRRGARTATTESIAMFLKTSLAGAALLLAATAHAGPYAPAAGKAGSTAIAATSAGITNWATGYFGYQPGANVTASFQTPAKALGAATGSTTDVVVLGDNGRITLTFSGAIYNGAGADFAVFENSFSDTFLELAWVEVSSDGTNFFRFPGTSLTASPVGSFNNIDPTNIDGLAGKYRAGWGTPFDLSTLAGTAGLDIDKVQYVRLVDIKGDGSVLDSAGHAIYDPYPTSASGGFDLEAVGVLHWRAPSDVAVVPEPSTLSGMLLGALGLLALGRRRAARAAALAIGAMAAAGGAQAAVVSDFEQPVLAADSAFAPGADSSFTSGAASFAYDYSDWGGGFWSWSGWTYSNRTDATTPGYDNQYSAWAGSGAGGSAQYAVAYLGDAQISLSAPAVVQGVSLTNTTYTALSLLQGDAFAKKFGGASGNDADWLKLTITGIDTGGAALGSVDFYLADYRFADNNLDYVVRDWTFVDLSSLGTVAGLRFALSSSDIGDFGMNTPAYFALDDLSVNAVPEPSALWLAGVGALAVAAARRRRA